VKNGEHQTAPQSKTYVVNQDLYYRNFIAFARYFSLPIYTYKRKKAHPHANKSITRLETLYLKPSSPPQSRLINLLPTGRRKEGPANQEGESGTRREKRERAQKREAKEQGRVKKTINVLKFLSIHPSLCSSKQSKLHPTSMSMKRATKVTFVDFQANGRSNQSQRYDTI